MSLLVAVCIGFTINVIEFIEFEAFIKLFWFGFIFKFEFIGFPLLLQLNPFEGLTIGFE